MHTQAGWDWHHLYWVNFLPALCDLLYSTLSQKDKNTFRARLRSFPWPRGCLKPDFDVGDPNNLLKIINSWTVARQLFLAGMTCFAGLVENKLFGYYCKCNLTVVKLATVPITPGSLRALQIELLEMVTEGGELWNKAQGWTDEMEKAAKIKEDRRWKEEHEDGVGEDGEDDNDVEFGAKLAVKTKKLKSNFLRPNVTGMVGFALSTLPMLPIANLTSVGTFEALHKQARKTTTKAGGSARLRDSSQYAREVALKEFQETRENYAYIMGSRCDEDQHAYAESLVGFAHPRADKELIFAGRTTPIHSKTTGRLHFKHRDVPVNWTPCAYMDLKRDKKGNIPEVLLNAETLDLIKLAIKGGMFLDECAKEWRQAIQDDTAVYRRVTAVRKAVGHRVFKLQILDNCSVSNQYNDHLLMAHMQLASMLEVTSPGSTHVLCFPRWLADPPQSQRKWSAKTKDDDKVHRELCNLMGTYYLQSEPQIDMPILLSTVEEQVCVVHMCTSTCIETSCCDKHLTTNAKGSTKQMPDKESKRADCPQCKCAPARIYHGAGGKGDLETGGRYTVLDTKHGYSPDFTTSWGGR